MRGRGRRSKGGRGRRSKGGRGSGREGGKEGWALYPGTLRMMPPQLRGRGREVWSPVLCSRGLVKLRLFYLYYLCTFTYFCYVDVCPANIFK